MRIFYDVDTQNDFMNKDGALYVADAESIKPNLALLTENAKKNKIAVYGSVDKHFGNNKYRKREGELAKWGGPFPDHCMNGTQGELKIYETRFGIGTGRKADEAETQRYDDYGIYIEHANELRYDTLEDARNIQRIAHKIDQAIDNDRNENWVVPVYFEKQNYDVFTNPATKHVLKLAKVKEAIVYGVATDYCVKAAVLGMQNIGIQCYVVSDAIKGVFPESTKTALEEMVKAGAKFVKTKEVLEGIQ